MKFHFNSSDTKDALGAKDVFVKKYGQNNVDKADIIIPIGGDGFLLRNLHKYNELNKPFFGINYGSIGFLMNPQTDQNLEKIIKASQVTILNPLQMQAFDKKNKSFASIAYNEVSLMRQTHQAAKINIKINDIERMKKLICDGVLVSTAAGSTAYNLSAHGSIMPLDSNLLALTPISAFRPRRWRGALLKQQTKIELSVIDFKDRPASVTADNSEFRNIQAVVIKSSKKNFCKILFNSNYSMEERILKEQFYS
jgi:NAD+ kinase